MPDHEIHLTVVGPDYEWDWSCDAGQDAARAAAALREFAALIGAAVVGAWPQENVRDQIARIGRDFPEFPAPTLLDMTQGGDAEPLTVTSMTVSQPVMTAEFIPVPPREIAFETVPLDPADADGAGMTINPGD